MAKWLCFAIILLFFLPNIGGINENDEMLVSIYPLKQAKSYATHVSIPFVIKVLPDDFISLSKNKNSSFKYCYTIEWGDGSIPQIIFTNKAFLEVHHSYENEGIFTIKVKVKDSETNEVAKASYEIKIKNEIGNKPVAIAKIPSIGYVNEVIVLDASKSYPAETIINYTWFMGNGDTVYGEKALYTYKKEGKYTVKLVVTDNNGNTDFKTNIIEIRKREKRVLNEGGVDQSQEKEDGYFKLYGDIAYAQSFKPEKYYKFVGVDLLIGKKVIFNNVRNRLIAKILSSIGERLSRLIMNIQPVEPNGWWLDLLRVTFRESLDGEDLLRVYMSPRDVPDKAWLYFDFSELDYKMKPNREYYIFIKASGGNERNYYKIFYGDNNPYNRGSAYIYQGGTWSELNQDLCFREYGEYEGNEPDGVTEHWALVIGCGHYNNGRDIPMVINSARDIASLLSESGWSVNLLIDATRDEILNGLEWLEEQEDADDVVLFYFSGHGSGSTIQGSIQASDCSSLTSRFELKWAFDSMYSTEVVMIFDSCGSGAFITARYNLAEEGRIILAASRWNEYAYGDSQLNAATFSYYLVQGLKGPADGISGYMKNNEVSAEEAFTYAAPLTDQRAHQFNQEQHPQMYDGIPGEVTLTKV